MVKILIKSLIIFSFCSLFSSVSCPFLFNALTIVSVGDTVALQLTLGPLRVTSF